MTDEILGYLARKQLGYLAPTLYRASNPHFFHFGFGTLPTMPDFFSPSGPFSHVYQPVLSGSHATSLWVTIPSPLDGRYCQSLPHSCQPFTTKSHRPYSAGSSYGRKSHHSYSIKQKAGMLGPGGPYPLPLMWELDLATSRLATATCAHPFSLD